MSIAQRQREELLRRPLWNIAIERMQTFFGEHSMSSSAYAGAMAAVMVAGLMTDQLTLSPRTQKPWSGGGQFARRWRRQHSTPTAEPHCHFAPGTGSRYCSSRRLIK